MELARSPLSLTLLIYGSLPLSDSDMPSRSAPKASDKPIRSIVSQLKNMFVPDFVFFIMAALRESRSVDESYSLNSSPGSSSSGSPLKRKSVPSSPPSTPSTPSPKKRKETEGVDIESPVLNAMAGLNPSASVPSTPSRPARVRGTGAKAVATKKQSSAKKLGPSYQASKQVAQGHVESMDSVISLSSSSEDDVPSAFIPRSTRRGGDMTASGPGHDDIEQAIIDRDIIEDDMVVVDPRSLFDIEAVEDNLSPADADNADDEATVGSDLGSLADFIVPDDEIVEDGHNVVVEAGSTPPPKFGLARKSYNSDDVTPDIQDDEDIFQYNAASTSIDPDAFGIDPGSLAYDPNDQDSVIEMATVLATLIMGSAGVKRAGANDDQEDGDPDEVVVDRNVMRPDLQEAHMKFTYQGLCNLRRLFEIIPYGYDERITNENRNEDGDTMFRHSQLGAMAQRSSYDNFVTILTGMLFVRSGPFMSPIRVNVDDLCSSGVRRLAFKGGAPFCICIMIGVVSECYLIGSLDVGTEAYPKPQQRRISIIIPEQEERRAISATCEALGLVTNPKGFYSYNGWSFVTNYEKVSNAYTSKDGYTVPKSKVSKPDLPDAMFTVTPSKKRVPNQSGNELQYPTTNFDSRVPIFDGRVETGDPFRFTGPQFDSLLTWRPYKDNCVEVPKGSVVAVGYTVNHYALQGAVYMPTYVKFVMVLSTPDNVVGISTAPATDALPDRKGKGKAGVSAKVAKPVTRSSLKGKQRGD
ncbi:hypothetical protein H0H93_007835 [Arthromyces matolae]|nr:hypothetical protein H0H93_007835 [Arthromyces matolae]